MKAEGNGSKQECRELFPLSFTYAQQNAGWNMVVLQRCRLQYSLFRPILPSLHRPLGALGSNPPQAVAPLGAVYNSHIKPALKGEVDMSVSEWTEGLKKERRFSLYRQPLSQ